jgi:hypothetical protein
MATALNNLCGPGRPLRQEAPDEQETEGLVRTGRARLKDAANASLAIESRFDLAYNAADVDERLVTDLIKAAQAVADAL